MSEQTTLFDSAGWADIDGPYRYRLGRMWGPVGGVVFVMLNPSTADATQNDPTIRRCLGFARREGWGSLDVVNLFGLRATNPAELAAHPDPVGPRNDAAIGDAIHAADAVICAWGAHPMTQHQDRAATVLRLLRQHGSRIYRLGPPTRSGAPRHPLYLPANAPLELL